MRARTSVEMTCWECGTTQDVDVEVEGSHKDYQCLFNPECRECGAWWDKSDKDYIWEEAIAAVDEPSAQYDSYDDYLRDRDL